MKYLRKDKLYEPIKVGDIKDRDNADREICIDCGAKTGEYHRHGCDYELCPRCGQYLMNCKCGLIYVIDDNIGEEELNVFFHRS